MSRGQPLTLDEIRSDFERLLVGPQALAVSGGADSMALMQMVAAWVAEPGTVQRQRMGPVPLLVLTVDHRLRPQSADEAAWVKGEAARLGLPHETLVWDEMKPLTGLQSTAREARYRLMNEYIERELGERRVAVKRRIVVAHHDGDQAETFLMRLARGSGLDGLSGMREEEQVSPPRSAEGGASGSYTIVRPLLRVPKTRLVATLEAAGRAWRDDPSNLAQEFERVRVRQALEVLAQLGIEPAQIGRSAWRLSRARRAVIAGVDAAAFRAVKLHRGLFAEIDSACLARLPDEFGVRIFAALLQAFGGAGPPARLSQIEPLVAKMMPSNNPAPGPRAETLAGCRIERDGAGPVRIWREWGREGLPALDLQPGSRTVWDERFSVALASGETEPARVCALGANNVHGLGDLGGLTELQGLGAPPDAIRTLPSFWQADRLVAVPYFSAKAGQPGRFSAHFLADDALWSHT